MVLIGGVAGRRSRLVAEFFVSDLDAVDAAQAQLRLPPQVFEEAVMSDEQAGVQRELAAAGRSEHLGSLTKR